MRIFYVENRAHLLASYAVGEYEIPPLRNSRKFFCYAKGEYVLERGNIMLITREIRVKFACSPCAQERCLRS